MFKSLVLRQRAFHQNHPLVRAPPLVADGRGTMIARQNLEDGIG